MIETYRNIATIQAEQFDGSDAMVKKYHIEYDEAYIFPFRIETPDGWLGTKVNDWIVIEDNGKYLIIEDEVFKKTYTYAC